MGSAQNLLLFLCRGFKKVLKRQNKNMKIWHPRRHGEYKNYTGVCYFFSSDVNDFNIKSKKSVFCTYLLLGLRHFAHVPQSPVLILPQTFKYSPDLDSDNDDC